MDQWFEDKFNKRNLRKYTRRRLKRNSFDNFTRKFSITTWIIIVNVVVFIAVSLSIGIFGEEKVLSLIALQANAFFSGAVWTLLTSMFMHGNITHLFVNMVSLFFLGMMK